jgi:N-acetylglucosaminyl-diphospho-decaprenol L-rhamnosyltransferase
VTTTAMVLVAFRSAAYLEQGLPPVVGDPCVGDVVVVDNSSDPATAEVVARFGDRVRYVDPGANLGFAAACNLGYRSTSDPVVTFLNPDVLLDREVGELVGRCAAERTAVVAGGLTFEPGDVELANARRAVSPLRELQRAVLGAGSSVVTVPAGTSTVAVEQVDGAFLMAPRPFLESLGGFDERFELYFEDVDLCDRARAAGRVLLDTRPYGTHAHGASSRTVAGVSYCVFRVSRVRYFAKRWGVPGAVAAVLITVAEVLVRTVTRQPEGRRVRLRSLGLAVRELAVPGSVRVLSDRE